MEEGDDVLFVLDNGYRYPGEVRPAKIVRVWNKEFPYTSNLCVFIDGSNDLPQPMGEPVKLTVWETSRLYSENKEPGTWHKPLTKS